MPYFLINLLSLFSLARTDHCSFFHNPRQGLGDVTLTERAVDQQITQHLKDRNPDLIWTFVSTMRASLGLIYTPYIDICQTYTDRKAETAVDGCRHDPVVEVM